MTDAVAAPAVPEFAIAKRVKDSIIVDILDPAGQPTGIRIHLAGRYTEAARTAQALFAAVDESNATDHVMAAVVALTIGWEGVVDEHDQPCPCTPDIVRALYAHPKLPWIFAQVSKAFADQSRFFESAKAS